jgi:hypothetical protein
MEKSPNVKLEFDYQKEGHTIYRLPTFHFQKVELGNLPIFDRDKKLKRVFLTPIGIKIGLKRGVLPIRT